MISIIIPIFNAEKNLKQCISSVLSQDYHDIEVIAVDDGSEDHSLRILNDMRRADTRLRIVQKQNEGVSRARNIALEAAQGDYVLFVDSDDWLDSDVCRKVLSAANKIQADVVLFPYQREYPTVAKETRLFEKERVFQDRAIAFLRRRIIGFTDAELSNPQGIDNLVTVWGKLYRREVLVGKRFRDMSEVGVEDLFFNIEVFWNVKSAVYISDTFYHYRKDDMSSLTHCYKKDLAYRWQHLYGLIEMELREHHVTPDFYEALSNRICFGLIGLGLNLAEDKSMKHTEKLRELRKILLMDHYRSALNRLPIQNLPAKWKPFFYFAKHGQANSMFMMLSVMNILRRT